jgi:hypothetical protein
LFFRLLEWLLCSLAVSSLPLRRPLGDERDEGDEMREQRREGEKREKSADVSCRVLVTGACGQVG